jgi:MFS family permease
MGSFVSAFLLTSRGAPSVSRILLSGLGFGFMLIAISLTENLWLSCSFFVVVGASAVAFSTSVSTSLQLQSPPDMRGRFASMVHLLITGSSPIGAMLTGVVAEKFGVWISIFVNGALCCVGIGLAFAYFRWMRNSTIFDLGRAAERVEEPLDQLAARAAE